MTVTLYYSRIIVDTFDPANPTAGFNPNSDVVSLYTEAGAASATNPWTDPGSAALVTGATASNALATGFNNNPNTNQTGYAYIDYSPPAALPSGTVLYIRITGYSSGNTSDGSDAVTGPFGVRVLTAESATYPTLALPAQSVNEPDGTLAGSGVPTIGINQPLTTYLTTTDTDWIKLVLPYG